MKRRIFLALIPLALHAEQKPPTYALLSSLASYLSDGNAQGAMSAFSKSMPNYHSLEANVTALTAQADILCNIELLDDNEADWFLEIKSKENDGPTERRQQTVKLTFEQQGKNWKITSINPASILDPLHF
jgi:hypothetical protein